MSSSFFVVWKPFIEVVSTLNLALLEPCACEELKDWSLWSVDEAEFFVIVKPWFLAKRKETVQHYYQFKFFRNSHSPCKRKKKPHSPLTESSAEFSVSDSAAAEKSLLFFSLRFRVSHTRNIVNILPSRTRPRYRCSSLPPPLRKPQDELFSIHNNFDSFFEYFGEKLKYLQ